MPPKRKRRNASARASKPRPLKPRVRHASHSPSPPATASTTVTSLTAENLDLLQEQYSLSEMPPKGAPSTASRTNVSNNVEEQRTRLRSANIFFNDDSAPIPKELHNYLHGLLRERDYPSPVAGEIAKNASLARKGNERDARSKFEAIMLLATPDEGGHEWVTRLNDTNLNSDFNPPVVSKIAIADGLTSMTQAQPDTCIGYLPSSQSTSGWSKPFNDEQEDLILRRLLLNSKVFFPYLTIQWKRGQSHDAAIPQGARDGAVIMHHLRTLHPDSRTFNNASEYLIHTSHISLTFDGWSVLCFVHWYDTKTGRYHMAHFHTVGVDIEAQNIKLRALLRNLQDVALGERLDRIKLALDRMYASITNSGDGATLESEPLAKKAKRSVAQRPVERPPTPDSSASAPRRKSERQRKKRDSGAA